MTTNDKPHRKIENLLRRFGFPTLTVSAPWNEGRAIVCAVTGARADIERAFDFFQSYESKTTIHPAGLQRPDDDDNWACFHLFF